MEHGIRYCFHCGGQTAHWRFDGPRLESLRRLLPWLVQLVAEGRKNPWRCRVCFGRPACERKDIVD